MAIVSKLCLDHILIQFSYGGEHQKAPVGGIEGAQFAEVEYMVDDATGKVVGKADNPVNSRARPLEPAKVESILGSQFSTYAEQIATANKTMDEAIAERDETKAQCSAHERRIESLLERVAETDARLREALRAQELAEADAARYRRESEAQQERIAGARSTTVMRGVGNEGLSSFTGETSAGRS